MRSIFTVLVLIALAFALQGANAATTYVYDDAGRIVQAVEPDGSSIQYQYDAVGNMTSMSRIGAGTIAIASLAPAAGNVGTSVTIYGSGFSSTIGNNVVKFNGTTATITSASPTQLVAIVPAGATTGTVGVTNSSGSATSTTSFVVTTPTITSFSPAIGTSGTQVAINGSGFVASTSANTVTLNGVSASVSFAVTTRLQTAVPAGATSGRITVSNAFGTTQSLGDFIVPPSGYGSGDIAVSGRLGTNGATLACNLTSPNKAGIVLFDGAQDQVVHLFFTNVTLSGGTYQVLKPDGSQLASGGITNNAEVVLPQLSATGTYTIVIANGANTGSVTVKVIADLAGGTLTFGAAPVTYNATVPNQNMVYTFSGTTDQYISLLFTNNSIPSGSITLINPNGSTLSTNNIPNTATFGASASLPATGTYKVIIKTTVTGHIDTRLFSDATATVVTNGTPFPVNMAVGQNGLFPFTASGPTTYSLAMANFTSSPAGGVIGIYVVNSANAFVVSCPNFSATSGSCDFSVPAAGTYRLRVYSASGFYALSANFILSADLAGGGLTFGGAPVTFNATVPGQNMVYTFSATADQYLSLLFTNNTIPSGSINLIKPDGSTLSNNNIPNAATFVVNATAPATGTYKVIVFVNGSATGHIDTKLFADATATIVTDGTPFSVNLAAGQNGIYPFTASGPTTYSLAMTSFVSSPTGGSLGLYVVNSSNAFVVSCNPFSGAQTQCNFSVPAAGTYRLRFYSPAGIYALSANFALTH